jgi:serine protease Do
VVYLRAEIPKAHPSASILGEERAGSGVVVAPDRVLTAHYLVLGAATTTVAGLDGRQHAVDRVALDHDSGLAVLSLRTPAFRAVTVDAAPLQCGDPVFLIASATETERRVANGHVISAGPFEAFWEYMLDRAIITTAPNPGLSGAPLFDSGGRLRAVVALGLAAVGRHSLAIGVDLYTTRREELEANGTSRDWPPHAWIGVYAQAADGSLSVRGVVAGGPAELGGLERGDVILSVDGTPTADLRELYGALWRKGPGDKVGLQVLRDASIRLAEITAGDRYLFFK